ncbi:MAG TPA: tRNA pseudouridine(55) synthase TruB [Candidatus Saccharimonadales bacterium]
MNGYILIDKPKGWTSFDAVNKVRRIVQNSDLNTTHKKRFPVGHTGTLDPSATGLLVLLLGKYTKRAPELTKLDKTYEVTMRLGQTSTTGDIEGEMTTVSDKRPDEDAVRNALNTFVGDQMQTPPIYSAIKINGQRAYKLARAGKTPELKPRPVHINSITFDSCDYPTVKFTADVSSGTYIRSLVEDIGKLLGTGAYMSDLRRTRIGDFSIADAMGMENLSPEVIAAHTIQFPAEPQES